MLRVRQFVAESACWISGFAASIAMANPMFSACGDPALSMPTTWPDEVDQRAAGVAGVDGGVGLQDVVVGPAARRARSGPAPGSCGRASSRCPT